jgi:hypothetical protein
LLGSWSKFPSTGIVGGPGGKFVGRVPYRNTLNEKNVANDNATTQYKVWTLILLIVSVFRCVCDNEKLEERSRKSNAFRSVNLLRLPILLPLDIFRNSDMHYCVLLHVISIIAFGVGRIVCSKYFPMYPVKNCLPDHVQPMQNFARYISRENRPLYSEICTHL